MTCPSWRIGASYYPERWLVDIWKADAKLMEEAGCTLVRMGEFAWSRFEPKPGVYDFQWMDQALSLFQSHGISAVLCTPTATPPPWIVHRHPEMRPVTAEGWTFGVGNRRHYCFNHLGYQEHSVRIARALGQHYAEHPGIIGWQIDNEPGGDMFICYCETCRTAFQQWLKKKYHTLEELNHHWGGVFWSMEFTDWEEIPVPIGHNVQWFNPSLKYDYLQFHLGSVTNYLNLQVSALRESGVTVPITTNRFTPTWSDLFDYPSADASFDVTALDNYSPLPLFSGYDHDLFASCKPRKYWLLECSHGDSLKLMTVQALSHGAEFVCYFNWRQVPYGTEQDNCKGIIPMHGHPGRTYSLLADTTAWLERETPSLNQLQAKPRVALLRSSQSCLLRQASHYLNNLKYDATLADTVYGATFELGQTPQIIHDDGDFRPFSLLLIPLHLLEDKALLDKLQYFVQQGGCVILTADFMLKNADNWRVIGGAQERLWDFAGYRLDDISQVTQPYHCHWADGKPSIELGSFQAELSVVQSVDVLAHYLHPVTGSPFPAVLQHKIGSGTVISLAGMPNRDGWKMLLRYIAPRLELSLLDVGR